MTVDELIEKLRSMKARGEIDGRCHVVVRVSEDPMGIGPVCYGIKPMPTVAENGTLVLEVH